MNIRLLASDLDGTLLGDEVGSNLFTRKWQELEDERRPFLCFNTGRLLSGVLSLVKSGKLPEPDYIISGVGTSIYDYKEGAVLKEFAEILEEGWDIGVVERVMAEAPLALEKQPAHFQNAYKSSWYLDDAEVRQLELLAEQLEGAGLDVNVVYSSNRHLDILPKAANKGNALKWLLRHLNIKAEETIVAGDSGNDSAMFSLPGVKGIVVGNAQPELLLLTDEKPFYRAPQQEICGLAVLSGLRHYGVIEAIEVQQEEVEKGLIYNMLQASGDEQIDSLSREQIDFIRHGYHQAIQALKKTITPMGFSACSLNDNETVGTDENYYSVWARDGAITVLGSLSLLDQDEEIHACQRQTLETLLAHLSLNGQFPANVRISDQSPDYSGVGGIASIDSGLWVIIAFYAYVAETRDLEFLRKYLPQLQTAMDWLSAHDSNNDALLEIPEAGDWTDLFGRRYNVLYDEVLWYRCNICFGRLLQMMGEEKRGSDYLRWARTIKREIRANFWPSTQERIYQSISFADQQFSIGDARYMIAQITPFDFSWRCDTFGNVLAYLYDVTDSRQASQTFRFLWGVGVNEPYPIANLYPVVTSGDDDWRSYYAVNLLNLPHHYHNGGIWPFVGGHWVRFVNKLGLRDLALQELYKLATVNKLGVLNEWEFNEWVHGITGRPMGKAYQAWSASEFIRACHALHVVA
ncbi:MAG TPA: HAD-IIB family hydrolase [Anaerolineae bacterium]|nr:HAD-IIB family hydrolase [Anaerolineae bacterium]